LRCRLSSHSAKAASISYRCVIFNGITNMICEWTRASLLRAPRAFWNSRVANYYATIV
jgi:hypothetical protein